MLIKLLKQRDLNGEGGVFRDDINESLAKGDKIVQNLMVKHIHILMQVSQQLKQKQVLQQQKERHMHFFHHVIIILVIVIKQ